MDDFGYPTYNNVSCADFFNQQILSQSMLDDDLFYYDLIWWLRNAIIIASSLALLINILLNCRRPEHKTPFNQLFTLMQIFYILSLLSVVSHNKSYNGPIIDSAGMVELLYLQNSTVLNGTTAFRQTYFGCLIENNYHVSSALEGLINLFSYNAYWLAVCMTLYVNDLLNDKPHFLRRRARLILIVSAVILVWYLVPFGLSFSTDAYFSFGPTGYRFRSESQLFFFGGLVNRQENQSVVGKGWMVAWMALPLLLCGYHIYLYCCNRRTIKTMDMSEQKNRKIYNFYHRATWIALVIMIVQLLNVIKQSVLVLISVPKQSANIFQVLLLVVNIIFDLMPFSLIIIQQRNRRQVNQHQMTLLSHSQTEQSKSEH